MNDRKELALSMLVSIAQKEVGTQEDEGRNNEGARIRDYQTATWLAPGAWPWCAALTCWVLREWLELPNTQDILNLKTKQDIEKWRCKDASAFGWEKWAKNKNLLSLQPTSLAKKGDFVVFEFSHIGIVIEDQKTIKTQIKTIEGNTNNNGTRDSNKGDGVWKKSRAVSLVKSYIRIVN